MFTILLGNDLLSKDVLFMLCSLDENAERLCQEPLEIQAKLSAAYLCSHSFVGYFKVFYRVLETLNLFVQALLTLF